MTVKFFYLSYKDEQLNIKKIEQTKDSLLITISFVTESNYIANGYRPDLDYEEECIFKFKSFSSNLIKSHNYIFNKMFLDEDNNLILIINNQEIHIYDKDIDVVQIDM